MSEWITPRDWSTDELVTAALLNMHLRDNLNALKSPPSQQMLYDNGGAYTTNSTMLVLIDGTNLVCTLTTHGGPVMVFFQGTFQHTVGGMCSLDVQIDGTSQLGAGFDALVNQRVDGGAYRTMIMLGPVLVENLDAGEHTFAMLWKTTGNTLSLQSDSGDSTTANNTPAILWAREVS